MAMNKAESARMRALEEALRLAPYTVATHLKMPDTISEAEVEAGVRACGWVGGWLAFSTKVEPYSTNNTTHWPGHGPYTRNTSGSQRMARLYRTEADAWRALAIRERDEFAKRMAGLMAKAGEE